MAQSSDMSLGSGGFAAGYTPITFAPLMSLTGPVMAQATAAPTAEAPMAPAPIRYPTMADMPDNAYMTGGMPTYGGPSIGNRSGADIRSDFARLGEFFMSPLSTMASYAATGKMPSEHMQALTGSAGGNPFAGFLQGLRGLFPGFGPEEVPLFETRAPVQTAVPSMVFDGGLYSVTPELAPIDQTNAIFNDPAFYNAIVAGVPVGQMQQTNMAPILEALNQSILQGTSTMEQFGPQETGGGYAPSDFGSAGANAPEGSSSLGDAISGAYGYI